ncbi:MAG: cellulase family glycosylhydrolase [Myxococcales bacterium]|nr:cellulase family glycosylhydrolase [Myxococcales bacterium]
MRAAILLAVAAAACTSSERPRPLALTRATTDRTYLRDEHGRYLSFHGINVSCSTKVPEVDAAGLPSYLGKPFALEEAKAHFARLRGWGFNAVRLLVMWEAVEPLRRGEYDGAYLAYLRELVKAAGESGLYVLLDMHQDMFSRHLTVKYNSRPGADAGTVESALLALARPYDDRVQGDGAPRWAVEACLQEKDLSSKAWGTPRILGGLTEAELRNIYDIYAQLTGAPPLDAGIEQPAPPWVAQFLLGLPEPFDVHETTDMLPFTNWGATHAASLDVARVYACFFAGDVAFPGLTREGMPVEEYLQSAYAAAWGKLAEEVADLPNVLGYDLMNEPGGNFLVLSAAAGFIKAGAPDGARAALADLLGPQMGPQVHQAMVALRLLPPDTKKETLRKWGLDKIDPIAVLSLNFGFDENHLRPFYERVGRAIREADGRAVIYVEGALSVTNLLSGPAGGGLGGNFNVTMSRPALPEVVYAPHWYPDIYPLPGFNAPPRSFTAEQVRHRDYRPKLEEVKSLASFSLGNVPTVFGEFGTYFNFNGIRQSRAEGYLVSAQVLDNYYEAFEQMQASRFLWCYSPENQYPTGDGWNREDFSIIDPGQKPRAELAWSRPYAKALAGKPIAAHFYSDLHYFDPDKGVVPPLREFEVRYASKETAAPTEIAVPAGQYPEGFYVFLSDGHCYYEPDTGTLLHFPSRDEPGFEHWVRVRPPLLGQENTGFRYFFKGDQVVAR